MKQQAPWPVLKTYDRDHLSKIAMPLGGIGTGALSLTGRGGLRDWEIMNRPAKGFAPHSDWWTTYPLFCLYARPAGGKASARLLEGPIELHGTLKIRRLGLTGAGCTERKAMMTLQAGRSVTFDVG